LKIIISIILFFYGYKNNGVKIENFLLT